MTRKDYWVECVVTALSETGVSAEESQIKTIAEYFQNAHENHSTFFGEVSIGRTSEVERLRRELNTEKQKMSCPECGGKGFVISYFGPVGRSSSSACDKCRGGGKVKI